MFSVDLDPQISTKIVQEKPKLVPEKSRRALKRTFSLKVQKGRFPIIEEPKKKEATKRTIFPKSSEDFSLKVGVSLPKLKSKEVSEQRIDAGEPHSNLFLDSSSQQEKTVSDSREALESDILNFLQCVEDAEQSAVKKDDLLGVVGPSKCEVLFKVPSSELKINEFQPENEKLEESNALKRWEFWMKDKKKLQDYLSRRLKRNPCALQIQESDKYRQVLEDKALLLYSQMPEADKWRGHPYRWKAELRIGLSRKKPLDHELDPGPAYCAVQTKLDKGEIPDMEFIGIPRAVKKEKSITCGLESSAMRDWRRLSYRQKQIAYFMEQRKRLKPHDIVMEELAVVGKKIIQEQQVKYKECFLWKDLPEIYVTSENPKNYFDDRRSIFCLDIDGEEIKYEIGTDYCQHPDKAFTWQVNFGVNSVGSLVEKVLKVENRGTVAISYEWLSHKIPQKQSLDILRPKRHEPWFFFNKNSGIFLPGQKYDLKFYHRAKSSGVQKEIWHLKATPPLSKNLEGATIILSALATDDLLDERDALESYLCMRVRDSVVAFALEIILYKVFSSFESLHEIEYRSIFCDKELFEYHNPKHYYHSTIVKNLYELFNKISLKTQTEWDLSLDSLIVLIETYKDAEEKDLFLRQVAENAKKLLKPNYLPVKKSQKYRMTYEILCKMTNFMEEDYDYIRGLLSQKKEEPAEKIWSQFEGTEEYMSDFSLKSEEMGELEPNLTLLEIKPLNFVFLQTMFYLKVYQRVCEAIEHISGIFETRKLFEPWKRANHKLEKPPRRK